jgi:hypothetical protein
MQRMSVRTMRRFVVRLAALGAGLITVRCWDLIIPLIINFVGSDRDRAARLCSLRAVRAGNFQKSVVRE